MGDRKLTLLCDRREFLQERVGACVKFTSDSTSGTVNNSLLPSQLALLKSPASSFKNRSNTLLHHLPPRFRIPDIQIKVLDRFL